MKPMDAAPLQEYLCACRLAEAAQARLAEYATAVEEFGLGQPGASDAPIRCRAGLLPPQEVLARAHAAAREVEQCTAQMQAARGRVLAYITGASTSLAQYRALRRRYVDGAPR